MFNKVYLGTTPIKKIYLGNIPIKYNTETEIEIPDNAVAVYTVSNDSYTNPYSIGAPSYWDEDELGPYDWTETVIANEDGTYTVIITALEAPGSFYMTNNDYLLTVEYIDTTNLVLMNQMFKNCSRLTEVKIPDYTCMQALTTTEMFYGCSSLVSVDMRNWYIRQSLYTYDEVSCEGMFYGCDSLTELRLDLCEDVITSNIINNASLPSFSAMDNPSLMYIKSEMTEVLDSSSLTGWNYEITSYPLMQYDFTHKDENNDLHEWFPVLGGIQQNIDWVYEDYYRGDYDSQSTITRNIRIKALSNRPTSIKMSGWQLDVIRSLDLTGVTSLSFNGCNWLSHIYGLSSTANITTMSDLFTNCSFLEVAPTIDCSKATSGLYGNTGLTGYGAFYECRDLHTLYLKNIYRNVTMNKGTGFLGSMAATQNQRYSIDLSYTIVKDECLLDIINELPDLINDKELSSSARSKIVLYLPPTNTLTAEQVQVAIDKGWTVKNTTY
jgi:hypothetical protein